MIVKVITTIEATDRQSSIRTEMIKTGLEYELIMALPCESIDEATQGWTEGADSLRRTTIKLVEEAIEKDDDLWIWEDDCVIDEFLLKESIKDLVLLNSFDFVHFNYSTNGQFSHKNIGCFRKTLDGVYNCQSYIINKGILKSYLDILQKKQPIDSGTKQLHKRNKNSYVAEMSPVKHKKGMFSTIRKKIVKY